VEGNGEMALRAEPARGKLFRVEASRAMRTWTRNLQVGVRLVEGVVAVELGALSWIIELATWLIKSRSLLIHQTHWCECQDLCNSLT
jgi:hypothetical protein